MKISRFDAEDIAFDGDAELREDYSGRGMYGKTCIGYTHSLEDVYSLVFAAVDALGRNEAEVLFGRARTDSMGKDMITYFPGVTIGDEKDGDE